MARSWRSSLTTRVLAGFAAAAVMFAAVSGIHLWELDHNRARAEAAETALDEAYAALRDTHANLFHVVADLRTAASDGGGSLGGQRAPHTLRAMHADLDRFDRAARRAAPDFPGARFGGREMEGALQAARDGVALLDTAAARVAAGRPVGNGALDYPATAVLTALQRLIDANRVQLNVVRSVAADRAWALRRSGRLWLFLSFLATLVIGWAISRSVSGRLGRLAAAARRMADGVEDDAVPPGPDDECADVRMDLERIRGVLVRRGAELRARDEALAAQGARLAEVERASEEKTRFIGHVSHEFRTPLSSIIGFSSLLAAEHARLPDARRGEYLEIVLRNARHLLHVINDLLNLSKVEAGKLEVTLGPVYVPEVVSGVVASLAPQADAREMRVGFTDAGRHFAHADVGRLRQVLLNLLENAIKYAPAGSRIDVRVSSTPDEVRVEVHDQGHGIAREDLPRLFKEFSRIPQPGAKVAGAGLGLALSRRLVELMGGRIGVESAPERGSVFWVALEAGDEIAGAGPREWAAAGERRARSETVAVVDDDPDIVAYASAILRHAGFRVVPDDGAPGVAARLAAEAPHLVLLDLSLAGRSGEDALREIRGQAALGRTPVVAFTAAVDPGVDVSPGGFQGYLVKPVEPEALLQAVEDALEEAERSASAPSAAGPASADGPREVAGDGASAPSSAAAGGAASPSASPTAAGDAVDGGRAGSGTPADGGDGPAQGGAGAAEDDDYLAPLRARFRAGLADRLAAMDDAVARNDRETLTREAHKLKGAAAGYGLEPLSRAARGAEEALHDGEGVTSPAVTAMRDHLRDVVAGTREA
jgi:signal transduction histidine kinase/HPt (histidine-containing phosphotransfer) domain-containing protein/ActR/RegA family two-component response regulator